MRSLKSTKFEESKRKTKNQNGWGMTCSCPIHASGTLSGKFDRKSLDVYEWDRAEAIARGLENADSWDVKISVLAPSDIGTKRYTIEEVSALYLASVSVGIQETSVKRPTTSPKQYP